MYNVKITIVITEKLYCGLRLALACLRFFQALYHLLTIAAILGVQCLKILWMWNIIKCINWTGHYPKDLLWWSEYILCRKEAGWAKAATYNFLTSLGRGFNTLYNHMSLNRIEHTINALRMYKAVANILGRSCQTVNIRKEMGYNILESELNSTFLLHEPPYDQNDLFYSCLGFYRL